MHVFGRRFFVLAVGALEETLGPGMPVVPVKGAGDGEERVAGGRIGAVPNEGVHPVFVRLIPRPVEIPDD